MCQRADAYFKPDYVTHLRTWVGTRLNPKCVRVNSWPKLRKQVVAVKYHVVTTRGLFATLSTTRGFSWSDNEVRALISIWGEDNIQEELDGAVRNQVIFNDIAAKMRAKGYDRDWQQCRTKIKNLKKEYRQTKDHNGKTGRRRKVCKFYKELDSILVYRPASVLAVLLDTGITNSTSSAAEPGDNNTEEKE